jgi:hypothetical protein
MGSWKKKTVNHSWQNKPISMDQYINVEKVKVFLINEHVHLFICNLGEEEGVF